MRSTAVVVTLMAIAVSCDRSKTGSAPTASSAPPTPIGTATVSGTVTFRGTPPPAEQITGFECHPGAAAPELRPVRVDANGGLQGAVVSLKGAVGGAKDAPQVGGPVLLDQVRCEYVPHVVALRTGQVLDVRSSDPTLHNVHGLSVENDAFNFGMVSAGQTKQMTFAVPESFKVKCDVHPWMSASVNVFDHPFYALTGPDGRYEIRNLPAGRHTLLVRHDFLGETEVEVTVEAGMPATADAAFGKRE
jgi:plastocyanin